MSESEGSLFDEELNIENIVKQTNIQYDEAQISAIKQAVQSKVMVLTGGPGTGKTKTTLGIIAFYNLIAKALHFSFEMIGFLPDYFPIMQMLHLANRVLLYELRLKTIHL